MKVLLSNWIQFIAIYLGFYFAIIGSKIFESNNYSWSSTLFQSLLTIPLLIIVYGLDLLWKFFVAIFILDILLFAFNNRWTKEKLIVEWFIISIPFVNAAFEYKYWAWLTISALFLLTQLYRNKIILRIINERKTATNKSIAASGAD
ncbi:MAG: hypothetical protein ACTHM5_08960 [Ginsengibacter sp.]